MDKVLRAIGLVSRTPLLLVAGATSPASVPDLIAQAKAKPGKLSHGSAGIGSISHIVAKAFAQAADISLLHVPCKGNGAALIDLVGGQVNLVFDSFLSSAPPGHRRTSSTSSMPHSTRPWPCRPCGSVWRKAHPKAWRPARRPRPTPLAWPSAPAGCPLCAPCALS